MNALQGTIHFAEIAIGIDFGELVTRNGATTAMKDPHDFTACSTANQISSGLPELVKGQAAEVFIILADPS